MSNKYKFVCPHCGAETGIVEVTHGLAEHRAVSEVELMSDGTVCISTDDTPGYGELDEDDGGAWVSYQCQACHAELPKLATMVEDNTIILQGDEQGGYPKMTPPSELSSLELARLVSGYAAVVGALTGLTAQRIREDIREAQRKSDHTSWYEQLHYVFEEYGFPNLSELWLMLRTARTDYNKMTKEERHRSSYKG